MAKKVTIWSIDEMTEAFGLSKPSIGTKVGEGLFIKVGKGEYDSVQSVKNYRMSIENDETTKSAADERARLDKERADKIAMENAQTRKELVNMAEAQREYISLNHAIRQKLFSIAPRAAPLLEGKTAPEIQSKLHNFLNEIMRELRDPDFVKMIDDRQSEKRQQKINRKKNA
jgi:phage terminase Nu1 subunit (DNA packaging protein)